MNQDEIKKRLEYKDGKLLNKIKTLKKNIGDEVGCINTAGYKVVRIQKKLMFAHRVIWLMHYGSLPKYIDHIDGNKLNNCISNLRAATPSQNSCNSKRKQSNLSGVKGVFFYKPNQKWSVQIMVNYKKLFYGYYVHKDIAETIAMLTRIKHHGEFANHG